MAGLCPQAQPGDTGLSARELATEREDGEPTRPRVVPAELSDEDWRLVSERHLSDIGRIDAYDLALGRMPSPGHLRPRCFRRPRRPLTRR